MAIERTFSIIKPDATRRNLTGAVTKMLEDAGLRVVAWYLPSFLSVKTAAAHALAAIRFRSAHGESFDGFALDIEATSVRSLTLRDHRLLVLSSLLSHAVPSSYPLGAITPSPVGMSAMRRTASAFWRARFSDGFS